MIYLDLLLGFFKVGCFSFGGAYAAIPLIRDVVRSYGWMNDELLSYMIAVSESTPGPIMVNMATYVGSNQGGLLGAILATTAVVLPAFLIILLVTAILKALLKNPYVQAVLNGLKPCIIGIILATGMHLILTNLFTLSKNGALNLRAVILSIAVGLLWFGSKPLFHKSLSPITLIGISALLGILVYGF